MKVIKLDTITTTLPKNLKDILKKININEQGIIFIIDEDSKLIGSISDGDIRRKILEGNKINEQVNFKSSLVNKNFVSAKYNSSIKQITAKFDKEINGKIIKCLPLIDDKGRIIDFATKERIKSFPISNLSMFNVISILLQSRIVALLIRT